MKHLKRPAVLRVHERFAVLVLVRVQLARGVVLHRVHVASAAAAGPHRDLVLRRVARLRGAEHIVAPQPRLRSCTPTSSGLCAATRGRLTSQPGLHACAPTRPSLCAATCGRPDSRGGVRRPSHVATQSVRSLGLGMHSESARPFACTARAQHISCRGLTAVRRPKQYLTRPCTERMDAWLGSARYSSWSASARYTSLMPQPARIAWLCSRALPHSIWHHTYRRYGVLPQPARIAWLCALPRASPLTHTGCAADLLWRHRYRGTEEGLG